MSPDFKRLYENELLIDFISDLVHVTILKLKRCTPQQSNLNSIVLYFFTINRQEKTKARQISSYDGDHIDKKNARESELLIFMTALTNERM